MTEAPDPATALELERIRGQLGEGFAKIEGGLALLVQRSDQTDRALGHQRAELVDQDRRLTELERAQSAAGDLGGRVNRLEARRWPLPAIGALTGVGALVIAAASLLHH
ncbi:hypothetical protein [Kitasatospora viridis]|uniref:Uncharacterized protein n=1 Tax=Kitasatospora viridis TaxID=281105 RepID=A0A561UKL0_9ACTN|nr:hypothetical protein [Kitasatospora viridis]TWF99899.1 hypothetical protein FHX73_113759 [Kitasatospora viridis]